MITGENEPVITSSQVWSGHIPPGGNGTTGGVFPAIKQALWMNSVVSRFDASFAAPMPTPVLRRDALDEATFQGLPAFASYRQLDQRLWAYLAACELLDALDFAWDAQTGTFSITDNGDGSPVCDVVKPSASEVERASLLTKAACTHVSNLDEIIAQADEPGLFVAIASGVVSVGGTGPLKPNTLRLFDVVDLVAGRPLYESKILLNVARPADVLKSTADAFTPAIAQPLHPSLPSGHTTYAFAFSRIVGAVAGGDSSYQSALDERALRIGTNREVAGVHTRLDTDAGRLLGVAIASWMLRVREDGRFPRWQLLYADAIRDWAEPLTPAP